MLQAMIDAAPIPIQVREQYAGDCEILMVYGTGHPVRRPWWFTHRRNGGRCIGWDLGYWNHDQTAMRVTIDEDHPQRMIREEPAGRWDAQGMALREDADPAGPAVIVGMGKKSLHMHGLAPLQWENAAVKTAKRLGKTVVFRPKRPTDPRPAGVQCVEGPIEEALRGASLVICRHSNVAIDACMAGVPVMCEDGAALALYRENANPSPAARLQFLRNLAWWQWEPTEAKEAWNYLLMRLCA